MEQCILVAIILTVVLVYIILAYIHYPKAKISEPIKNQILNSGLIHFTMNESAHNIQKEGLLT